MTPRPAAAPAGYRRKALRATRSAFATTAAAWQSAGRSGNININNNRREVGPLQASAVGPVQTAAPSDRANWFESSKKRTWSTPRTTLAELLFGCSRG